MNKCKIIAYYLPQFHTIPENDKWWGQGFTEWVNVKNAQPLFPGHYQPRVPLNSDYYDLSDVSVMKSQAMLAKEYGLYGFCFYHYWFSEKPLLEKPIINYLNDKSIDFPFCISWANESWTNAWAKPDNKVLIEQREGDKQEWKKHFDFLLPFFKDERYIKEDNCPLIVIYRPYLFEEMSVMLDYWKELAKSNGFNGLKIASQRFEQPEKNRGLFDYMDYHIEYQPNRCIGEIPIKQYVKPLVAIQDFLLRRFNVDISFRKKKGKLIKFDYDELWGRVLNEKPVSDRAIAGAFVGFDNTPRYKYRGRVIEGSTPEKFEKYMKAQIKNVKENYPTDYLFVFAWNEWGEGGYLEPDEKYKTGYLDAILKSLKNS